MNKYLMILCLIIMFSCTAKKEDQVIEDKNDISSSFSEEDSILFLSTQLNPIEEAQSMRNRILKGFKKGVDFQPNDNNYIFRKMLFEVENNPDRSILLGGLHGDYINLVSENSLMNLNNVSPVLLERNFIPELLKLGKMGTLNQFYYPWMQGTYIMMTNKKALEFLPNEADINNLTYRELLDWGKNIKNFTGSLKIGLPAGEKGLMHRFFQGYLYPSYTGSTLVKFRSRAAVDMWREFKELWSVTNTGSLVYSNMSQPLLTDDVWIVWDHTARLMTALKEKPDDYVVFPSPIGPEGRGYMTVLSGLSIPGGINNINDAVSLMEYLTDPEVQELTLKETGFFPVISLPENNNLSLELEKMNKSVNMQAGSKNSIATLLPMGLGEYGKEFNSIYMLTFSKIVLNNDDIEETLNIMAERLQNIINETGVSCWEPDNSKDIPCKLE